MSAESIFFETPSQLRRWLRDNAKRTELLWIGFHRSTAKAAGEK
jgi:hypothetical protein